MNWTVGVTTVPSRRTTTLPRTLDSLRAGGFDRPRIFVDGCNDAAMYRTWEGLEVTLHQPAMGVYGNWWSGLLELYVRNPTADRFAIFQDDMVCSRNLRQYLEKVPYPENTYLNLYTIPANQKLVPASGKAVGFFPSNQLGKGAVALVFDRTCVLELLSSRHMAMRPLDAHRGHKSVDGGVVASLKKAGIQEMCHNPSLIQHTGLVSTIGHPPRPTADSFRGETFDLLDLLE